MDESHTKEEAQPPTPPGCWESSGRAEFGDTPGAGCVQFAERGRDHSCGRWHGTASRPGLVWPLSTTGVRSGCVSPTPGDLEGPGSCARQMETLLCLPVSTRVFFNVHRCCWEVAACPSGDPAQRIKKIGIGRKGRRERRRERELRGNSIAEMAELWNLGCVLAAEGHALPQSSPASGVWVLWGRWSVHPGAPQHPSVWVFRGR